MLPVVRSEVPNFTFPPAGNTFARMGNCHNASTNSGKESTSTFPGPLCSCIHECHSSPNWSINPKLCIILF